MGARSRRPTRGPVWSRQLVIMVKAPVAGQVKTRLAHEIGVVCATQCYRHAAAAVIARIARAGGWRTTLAVAPDGGRIPSNWLRGVGRQGQGGGGLGERMQRIMKRARPGPVVIVGTDIPTITAPDIAAAFRALGHADAVFGPAGDGGYWLVGLRRAPRVLAIFGGVRWSSAHALADTKANLAGRVVAEVSVLNDVDGAADLARERGRHGRIVRGRDDLPGGKTQTRHDRRSCR